MGMSSTAQQLLEQALALDPRDRAELTMGLLDSFGPPGVWEEAEGTAELERRARRVVEQGAQGEIWAAVRVDIERELKR